MAGFFKGVAVGLAGFALGFGVLSLALEPPTRAGLPAAAPVSAPERTPEPEQVTDAPEAPVLGSEPAVAGETEETEALGTTADDERDLDEAVAEALEEIAADRLGEGDDTPAGGSDAPAEAPMAESLEGPPSENGLATLPAAEEGADEDPAPPAPELLPETDAPEDAPSEPEPQPTPPPATEPEPTVIVEAPAPADPAEAAGDTAAEPAPPVVLRAVPPSPGLDRAVDGVTTGRLPSIAPPAESATGEEDAAEEAPEPETLPARERHAAPYDPAPGPKFAIVLRDAPADPAAEAAIVALPMPVAVALDPHDPDAPRRAQAYRAAGHEVVILAAGLPQGATASDLEVTFEAWFRALPEAVAVIDPAEGGFQGNRGLAQSIMPLLAADGHGLLTHERGLNPAQQSANSAGVANATVFRIIDSDNENQFTIRRYLDRATFRAQQEGSVVVMGRAGHAETIDGLIGWRMEGRAGEVAVVPVSAVLRLP